MPDAPVALRILASLEHPKAAAALAREHGLPRGTAWKTIASLAHDGLIQTHIEGRDLVASSPSRAIPGLAATLLTDFPNQDWRLVFYGDRPTTLRVLDQIGRPGLAALVLGKSRRTVQHGIRLMAERGVVTKTGGRYQINPRIRPLGQLLDELDNARAHQQTRRVDKDARLLWYLGPEWLVRSRRPLDEPQLGPGALSLFAEYRVPLMMARDQYYFRTMRTLDAADAILQGLLVEPDSAVNRSYCAVVYEKNRPDNLETKARIYGLEQEAQRLIAYVDRRIEPEGFLPWGEHEEYRSEYGVVS